MTSPRHTITTQEIPGAEGIIVFHFSGELSSDSVTEINRCFDDGTAEIGRYTIIDLSEVTLISSAALGEFMGCRQRIIKQGGNLVFCGLNLELRTKLSLMGATRIFRIYPDIRSAINAWRWEIGREPEKIHVSFPPFLGIVPPLRQLVSRIARQKGYGCRDSFRIETIVDEICNNAVEHGKTGRDELVRLSATIDPDKIEIDIQNSSDPEKVASLSTLLVPDTPKKDIFPIGQKRGRGLTLIKMLSDELSVDCTESGTSVHVKKVREE